MPGKSIEPSLKRHTYAAANCGQHRYGPTSHSDDPAHRDNLAHSHNISNRDHYYHIIIINFF